MSWKSEELKQVFGQDFLRKNYGKISIDSRNIQEGQIFLCLNGENFKGSYFIEDVYKKKASLVITEELNQDIDIEQIKVEDSLKALWDMARFKRENSKAKFIAVTGSVGKTSCKEALKSVLSGFGMVYANPGNFNNHIGFPLSLANIDGDAKFAIFEIGMNNKGEIRPLCELLKPDISWITLVSKVHIGQFANEQEIAQEKSEIFSYLAKGGLGVLNADDKNFQFLKTRLKQDVLSFGLSEMADLRIKDIIFDGCYKLQLDFKGQVFELEFTHPNIEVIKLFLAVFLIADYLGLEFDKVKNLLKEIQPVPGRGDIFDLTKITLIDEAYNASPVAIKASLKLLKHLAKVKKSRRKVAILGDMLELGEESKKLHEDLKSDIMNNQVDKVVLVGKFMKNLFDILPSDSKLCYFNQIDDSNLQELEKVIEEGDIILVKASRSIGLDRIVNYLKEKF